MKDLSKQQMYDILERMSDGIVALDKNWYYVYVNKLGAEMLGRKPEDLIGKHIWTEFPEGIGQPFYRAYYKAMEEQVNIQIEAYYPPWNRWFENRIFASRDGITILYKDITESKKSEEELRESEARFRGLAENSNQVFWFNTLNPERVIYVNPAFERIWGVSAECVYQNQRLWLDLIHPEDKQHVYEEYEKFISSDRRDPYNYDVKYRIIRKDGDIRLIHDMGTLIYDEQEEIRWVCGIAEDISEINRVEEEIRISEQELRTVNRVIRACTSTMDLYDILQRVLDEALAITGLEGGTFCLLESDDTLSLGAQRNASDAMINDLTSHNIRVGDCLCGTVAHDKRPLILRSREEVRSFSTLEATRADDIFFHAAFPVMREDNCLGVLCVFTRSDRKPSERSIHLLETISAQISLSIENARLYRNILNYSEKLEEKVAERTADLEAANIRLKDLDRLKSIFIATMSHELRTPLNSIIGFTGIILQGMSGDISTEQRKQLSIVMKSSKHLLALINDVIDISKIEADRVELYPTDINLSSLIREVIGSFSNEVEEKGLSLDIKIPEKQVIRTDEKRVKQVLNNLLSNAIKFTLKGGLEIELIKEDGKFRINVRDTGVGIRPEDMNKLFKSFSKIRHDMPLIEGTGLGLYLSHKIAHLLGGELTAESEFGKGSTFTLIIPEGAAKI